MSRNLLVPAVLGMALSFACTGHQITDLHEQEQVRELDAGPLESDGDAATEESDPDAGAHMEPSDQVRPVGTRNFACAPSPSPMYQSQEVLKMRISGDFTRVNGAATKEEAITEALVDPDGPGVLEPVAAKVHARGISRFRECGYRPFSVKFAKKQKGNVFEHLGKSIKFSTHCGDREGMAPILKAPSLEEYEQRVRMEHAIYQVVDTLDTLSLKTRLVELTYHDTATDREETHLAFVREPEDELAQRCGMLEGEDIPADAPVARNERAHLLLYLINNFVIQADVKNKFAVMDLATQLRAQAPYDFDLVGVFRREYQGLDGRSLEDNARAFADWLRRNTSVALHEEVRLMLERAERMRAAFESAGLSEQNRALFSEWLDMYLKVLRDFRDCEGFASDEARAECHVPDDHANTAAHARILPLGEHSVMIEPPGDADVIALELEAQRLYTFLSYDRMTIYGPDGALLKNIVGDPPQFSVRPTEPGTYAVMLDRGDSLVCSDMWANQEASLAVPWAVYEDDHGSSVELASPLEPGVTAGAWELDSVVGLYDEDWFTIAVDGRTNLTFQFAGNGSGRIEAFALGGDPAQPAGTADIFGSTFEPTDLSQLFPEPGSYVVRVIQDFGPGTYTLELEQD
jgi:hypothetical protein